MTAVIENELPLKTTEIVGTATPVKVRKKRASKHDFKDGNGRVFAHRHDNGGGWVADTAKVAESVFVGKMAQVSNSARLSGKAMVMQRARVGGNAEISGNAKITKEAFVYGSAKVIDSAQITDLAQVSGGLIGGSTSILNRVRICNHPTIFDSTIRDECVVSGYAKLLNSTMDGWTCVGGEAKLVAATLSGFVTVGGQAKIISSKISLTQQYGVDTADPMAQTNRLKVIDFALICDCEHINAFLIFCGHAKAVGCTIAFTPARVGNAYERIQTDTQAMFVGLSIRAGSAFNAYNVAPGARPPMGSQPILPLNRPVDMAVLAPGRRVMPT